jgi:hypothetical protein
MRLGDDFPASALSAQHVQALSSPGAYGRKAATLATCLLLLDLPFGAVPGQNERLPAVGSEAIRDIALPEFHGRSVSVDGYLRRFDLDRNTVFIGNSCLTLVRPRLARHAFRRVEIATVKTQIALHIARAASTLLSASAYWPARTSLEISGSAAARAGSTNNTASMADKTNIFVTERCQPDFRIAIALIVISSSILFCGKSHMLHPLV